MTKTSRTNVSTLIDQARAITTVPAMCAWIDSLTLAQATAIDKFLLANNMVEAELFPNLPCQI